MDHFLLRDAGSMNPLGVGEPLVGLFWGPQVPFFMPQKSQKSVQKLATRVVEFKTARREAEVRSIHKEAV
jgi:hypothetical protein